MLGNALWSMTRPIAGWGWGGGGGGGAEGGENGVAGKGGNVTCRHTHELCDKPCEYRWAFWKEEKGVSWLRDMVCSYVTRQSDKKLQHVYHL